MVRNFLTLVVVRTPGVPIVDRTNMDRVPEGVTRFHPGPERETIFARDSTGIR